MRGGESLAGKRRFTAGYVALRFFIYSVLYIVMSDWLLYYLVSDPVALSRLQTAKGWGYVGLASILIYFLLSKHQSEIDQSFDEQKRTEYQLRGYIKDLDLLVDVSAALRESEDIDHMLPVLLDKTLEALNTDSGAITLFDVNTDELRYELSRGWFTVTSRTRKRPRTGISGQVYATGEPYMVWDFATDPLTRPDARPHVPAGWSGVCVPLRAHAHTIGVMFVSMRHPRSVAADELKIISSLADMTGVALHRTLLYEEALSRLNQLKSLRQIDLAIISNPQLTPTVEVIVDEVCQRLAVDAAAIYLMDEMSNSLVFSGGSGIADPPEIGSSIGLNASGLVGVVGKRDISTECPLSCKHHGFAACMSVPLTTQGRTVGLLTLFSKSQFREDSEWTGFMETLAGQATIAVETSRLFTEVEQSRQELLAAYESTIEGWACALDMRDKETEGHSRRVMELTISLAEAMGVPASQIIHLRRGAMLHDVGKMAIPDHILRKPGALSDQEWDIMRRHPVFAKDMLSRIDYLSPALDIPYSHHEKWDGTGYPQGLSGTAIPIAARIFAVVDVYDALLSDRPYRKAWQHQRAVDHIISQKGIHFDPEVVDLFTSLIN
jgi:HD-GYP domain-containing protein (c-di-GMP phosphodiesterase class II)